jgi:uncharacterized protein YceK
VVEVGLDLACPYCTLPHLLFRGVAMGRAALALAVALAVALVSGCGTMMNFAHQGWDKSSVYGGVGWDVKLIPAFADGTLWNGVEEEPFSLKAYMITLTALDVPLSAAADTLTLPLTIAATVKRESAKGTADKPSGATPVETQGPPASTPIPAGPTGG